MTGSNRWTPDSEVSGCMGLQKQIISDSVSFTRFSTPQKVKLTTQETQSKKTTEATSVDFVYNMRQSDGMSSVGWHGAGFLDGRLQYTGFSRYDPETGVICANQENFTEKRVEDVGALQKAIREYYGNHFEEFQQAVESLPPYMRDTAKKVLIADDPIDLSVASDQLFTE